MRGSVHAIVVIVLRKPLQISLHWCIITLKYIIILGQLSVHQKYDGEMPMHILALRRCIKRHRSVTSVGYTTRANDTMKAAGDKLLTGYVRQSFG